MNFYTSEHSATESGGIDSGGGGSATHQRLVLMILWKVLAEKMQKLWGKAKEACGLLRWSRCAVWTKCCKTVLTKMRHDFADAGGEHSPWLSAAMGRGGTRVARRPLFLPPATAAGRAESGMEARIRSGRGHGPPARTCAEAAAAAGRVETLAGHRRGGTELPDQCPNPPRRARERA